MNPDLLESQNNIWRWQALNISWNSKGQLQETTPAIVLIHGFGACKEHWRHNQPLLATKTICYALDLIGFGKSSQPKAKLQGDTSNDGEFQYGFDAWASQVAAFCNEVVKQPVILVGNSIGGVIALKASQLLSENCTSVVLIDCAQRTMDDKRLHEQPYWMQWTRPWLKALVRQRWLSTSLFKNAANVSVIRRVLMQAYPSGRNIDQELISLLQEPSKREGASEAFRGFINIFDDYLATELLQDLKTPVYMIWGEKDPWEPVNEAKNWLSHFQCVRSLEIIKGTGHCPHDEEPEKVNQILLGIIQQAT